ncbi:MAG: WG repeat-containing protein [Clostridia bacterium]|nr:WG repeat-containing protein [Clostridia bacterium]
MASHGKRYSGNKKGRKLNLKKVFAVLIAFAVIIMAIMGISKSLKNQGKPKVDEKAVATKYFAVYTGGKWGVINSKGETVIGPTYEETIIIPDNTKDVFLCTYNVNYTNNTYQTKVINSKNEEVITGYDTIQALENYDKNNNIWYENDVLLVSKDGKYGLVDMKGKSLLPCEYTSIEALKGVKNSILVAKENQYGLVDNIGAILIEVAYNKIEPISEKYENGYIVTDIDGNKGVINHDKTVSLQPKYQDILPLYGNGKYVAKEDGKWEIVDTQGNVYLKDKFGSVQSIDGENVIVKISNKYGIMTLDGETKIKTEYDDIRYAFQDNYIMKKNGKYGVVNLAGETVLDFNYESLLYRQDVGFFEGTKTGSRENDFIDTDMHVKVTGILSEINSNLGYMKIRVGNEYQYYNFKFETKTNQEVLKTNTIFLSKKDGKYGYVNKEGIVVVDYIYDDAREQNEFGYASVKKNGLWGCLDSKGKEYITPAYQLENNLLIEFIGKWHRGEDLNLNYYTD